MENRRLTALLAAILAAFALTFSGCSASAHLDMPAQESGSAAPPQNASSGTSDFSLPADMPAASTPACSAVPSVTPTRAAPTASSASAAPASFSALDYTASDGATIYYFSKDGVHAMGRDGGGDTLTGIRDCYQFLSINADGLYYLSYDKTYTPTQAEEEWQFCNAFNLMRYDAASQKSTVLMQHVLNASAFNNSVYAVDHTNHSHIVRYDLSQKSFSDVSGFPAGGDASNDVGVWTYNGTLYMDCGEGDSYKLYAITGNQVSANTVEQPEVPDSSGDGSYKIDYDHNGAVSIWTGSEFKALKLTNVDDVKLYNSKYYILTYDDKNMAALYSATVDGTVKKLAGPVNAGEAMISTEITAGWYFSFHVEEDGGTATDLVLKYKVG